MRVPEERQSEPILAWKRQDLEQRIGFRGGRATDVNPWLSFIIGALLSVGFYLALMLVPDPWLYSTFTRTESNYIPVATVLFTFWAIAILFIKSRKLRFQRRSLRYEVTPSAHDFVLSPQTVDQITSQLYRIVDDPKHFVLFNRISIAISNLKNLGRVTDVDDILRSQAEHDESAMETSYALVRGFVWAIPVFGFIGTVLGLSSAIGGFSSVLDSTQDVSKIVDALKGVTAGLSTAFETTLQALVAATVIQIWMTFLKKSEEDFLDECSEYCLRRVVSRLRLMPFEMEDSLVAPSTVH